MFTRTVVKKVPGEPLKPLPKEKQGYIEDLSELRKVELLELLERQDKLLSNTAFINKLPDKGKRIEDFKNRILKELGQRDGVQKACDLLSDLQLGIGSETADEIEWVGKQPRTEMVAEILDSDDESDESDPLKILASHGGAGTHQKQLRYKRLDDSLIKPEDLEDSKQDDPYVEALCKKVTKQREIKREPFKPYKTLKPRHSSESPSSSLNANKGEKHLNSHWEVTAATPPPPVHGDTKIVSLQESLELQKEQAARLKAIQAKHAAEKLASQMGIKMGSDLPSTSQRLSHRGNRHPSESSDSSDEGEVVLKTFEGDELEEEEDEDGVEKATTIHYTFQE